MRDRDMESARHLWREAMARKRETDYELFSAFCDALEIALYSLGVMDAGLVDRNQHKLEVIMLPGAAALMVFAMGSHVHVDVYDQSGARWVKAYPLAQADPMRVTAYIITALKWRKNGGENEGGH